ncbi:uncharacterized protein N7479_006629 [Penicillium vulpinum]|uniref:uncharacterized protein n=1 Tax=Penicillium vulpinum TaxID=29845 RepID=UPI002548E367|nr:uncharacterized protein N7479_006629 [Penicillium vulpinum]KAJ5959479.1 hypothetical protein N7479_006629 [Penicillium vulpinum]
MDCEISRELVVAAYIAIWVLVPIATLIAFTTRGDKVTKAKLTEMRNKWVEDKDYLLNESNALFDREAHLIEMIQCRRNRMIDDVVVDADALESMDPFEKELDQHKLKIRENWCRIADLLDRYSD